jgi:hypothetical protein
MTERLIIDDAEKQVFRDEDPNVALAPLRTVWKPGSAEFNRADLTAKATTALASNATFLALGAPTNAQVLTQVQRLTRENSALIRLALGLLDDISGT